MYVHATFRLLLSKRTNTTQDMKVNIMPPSHTLVLDFESKLMHRDYYCYRHLESLKAY